MGTLNKNVFTLTKLGAIESQCATAKDAGNAEKAYV